MIPESQHMLNVILLPIITPNETCQAISDSVGSANKEGNISQLRAPPSPANSQSVVC